MNGINPFAGTTTPENFIFWLNGFLADRTSMDEDRVKVIRSMLDMVKIPVKDDGQPNLVLQDPLHPNQWPTTHPHYPGEWKTEVTCQTQLHDQ